MQKAGAHLKTWSCILTGGIPAFPVLVSCVALQNEMVVKNRGPVFNFHQCHSWPACLLPFLYFS